MSHVAYGLHGACAAVHAPMLTAPCSPVAAADSPPLEGAALVRAKYKKVIDALRNHQSGYYFRKPVRFRMRGST